MKNRHAWISSIIAIACFVLILTASSLASASVLDLPQGLTRIEEEAFYKDTSLDEVYIPEGVTYIGPRAFSGTGLTYVTLPESLTYIADDAFDGAPMTDAVFEPVKGSYAETWCKNHGVAVPDDCTLSASATSWSPTATATTSTKSITVKCDTDYKVTIDQPGSSDRPTSDGFVSDWLSYTSTSTGIKLAVKKNYAGEKRTATVTVECAKHHVQKVITVTQSASTTSNPTVSVTVSPTTAAPGDTVSVKVTYKYSRLLGLNFNGLMTESGNDNVAKEATYSSLGSKTWTYSYTVPADAAAGNYTITASASSSDERSDSWAKAASATTVLTITKAAHNPDPEITVTHKDLSNDVLTMGATADIGATSTLSVTANTAWTASLSSLSTTGWVTISSGSSGSNGTSSLVLKINKELSLGVTYTADLNFKVDGSTVKTVKIKLEKPNPAHNPDITVTHRDLSNDVLTMGVTADIGATSTLSVTADTAWTASLSSLSTTGWVTISSGSSGSSGTSSLVLKINKELSLGVTYTADLNFKVDGSTVKTVKIKLEKPNPAHNPDITVTHRDLSNDVLTMGVTADIGATSTLSVTANTAWTASLSSLSTTGWVTISSGNSGSSGTSSLVLKINKELSLGVTYTANLNFKVDGSTVKTVKIRLEKPDPETEPEITVTHKDLSNNVLTMGETADIGATSTLSVTANTAWTASLSSLSTTGWVTISSGSSGSSGTSSLVLKINKELSLGVTYTANLNFKVDGSTVKTVKIKLEKPDATANAPVISLSTNVTSVSNSGSGQITMTFTHTYTDSLYVELLKGSTPVYIEDQWAGKVKKRVYDEGDWSVQLYSTTSKSHSATITIPSGTAEGSYTLRVTAENNDGLKSTDSVTVKVVKDGSDTYRNAIVQEAKKWLTTTFPAAGMPKYTKAATAEYIPTTETKSYHGMPYVGNIYNRTYSLDEYKALSLADRQTPLEGYSYSGGTRSSAKYGTECVGFVKMCWYYAVRSGSTQFWKNAYIESDTALKNLYSRSEKNGDYSFVLPGDALVISSHVRLVISNNSSLQTITVIEQTPNTACECTTCQNNTTMSLGTIMKTYSYATLKSGGYYQINRLKECMPVDADLSKWTLLNAK